MEHKRKVIRDNRRDKRAAANTAISLLARHQHIGEQDFEASEIAISMDPMKPLAAPHPTHDIQTLPAHKDII